MMITTQLVEGKIYLIGSGHAVATQRREKLFEEETHITPIPRPRFTPRDDSSIFNSEAVVQSVSNNAWVDSPHTKVTVRRAVKEILLPLATDTSSRPDSVDGMQQAGNSDSKVVVKLQEIQFDDQAVVTIMEHGLIDSGQYRQMTMDVGLSNYDGLHRDTSIPGIDLLGDDLDLWESGILLSSREGALQSWNDHEQNLFSVFSSQSSNSKAMSCYSSKSSTRGVWRSATNGLLFDDLDSVLPEGAVVTVQHLSQRNGCHGDGNDATELDASLASNLSSRSACEDPEDRHRHKRQHTQRSKESGVSEFTAPYEVYQQVDFDAVQSIPSTKVRDTFLSFRDPALRQDSSGIDASVPCECFATDVSCVEHKRIFREPFQFPLLWTEIIEEAIGIYDDQSWGFIYEPNNASFRSLSTGLESN
jgi:hypothetical protein